MSGRIPTRVLVTRNFRTVCTRKAKKTKRTRGTRNLHNTAHQRPCTRCLLVFKEAIAFCLSIAIAYKAKMNHKEKIKPGIKKRKKPPIEIKVARIDAPIAEKTNGLVSLSAVVIDVVLSPTYLAATTRVSKRVYQIAIIEKNKNKIKNIPTLRETGTTPF